MNSLAKWLCSSRVRVLVIGCILFLLAITVRPPGDSAEAAAAGKPVAQPQGDPGIQQIGAVRAAARVYLNTPETGWVDLLGPAGSSGVQVRLISIPSNAFTFTDEIITVASGQTTESFTFTPVNQVSGSCRIRAEKVANPNEFKESDPILIDAMFD